MFRLPIVVVIFNTLLQVLFVHRLARLLVTVREYGLVCDEIAFNKARAESLYVLQFASTLICPVFAQFVLDENCMRV